MAASISGRVRGSSGEGVKGAVIRAVHEPTGSTFAKVTGDDGDYFFDRIKVGGPYQISADHSAYNEQSRKGIHVRTEEAHVEDFDLARQG